MRSPATKQTLMGWQSKQILRHWTQATASERAVQTDKRISPNDRLRLR